MRRVPLLFLAFAAAVLVSGAAISVFTPSAIPDSGPAPDLASLFPTALPGWSVRDLPLAETEEAKKAVTSVLNFDRYISRHYQRGELELSVYVGYWAANKVPPRMVGVHTPDTCWVQNGWSRLDRRRGISIPTLGYTLPPAEFGVYTIQGQIRHVYFWHLVGGKPYAYEQEGLHTLTAPLQDLAAFGLQQRREQIFIRVASNMPFQVALREHGADVLLQTIARLQNVTPSR